MTFLLLLAAMAAIAGFAYWIGWDNRGDVEERRRWENRPTREAADQVLARADYWLANAPCEDIGDSIDHDLIRDLRDRVLHLETAIGEQIEHLDKPYVTGGMEVKAIARMLRRILASGVPVGGGEPQPTTSTDEIARLRAVVDAVRQWGPHTPRRVARALAALDEPVRSAGGGDQPDTPCPLCDDTGQYPPPGAGASTFPRPCPVCADKENPHA